MAEPNWTSDNGSVRLYCADVMDGLAQIEPGSVRCVVTSPPYWGLRDYGVDGQIGSEPTPDAFVTKMVEVFRAVRNVMTDDGTLWLNLGDSYAQSGGQLRGTEETKEKAISRQKLRGTSTGQHGGWESRASRAANTATGGLKPKDLIGIPWRVVLALQADGWWLRSDIIWHKPNPMPESCTDRPTSAHEHMFLLAKSSRYFYDAEAIREEAEYGFSQEIGAKIWNRSGVPTEPGRTPGARTIPGDGGTRNRRNVWTIPTQPYPDAHFATFPTKLVEPCILAGTSEKGHCPECEKPWVRVVERTGGTIGKSWHDHGNDAAAGMSQVPVKVGSVKDASGQLYQVKSLGWQPTCKHGLEPVPDVVLDPFAGSGTTMAVAVKHGRKTIGIELSEEYCRLIRKRVGAAMDDWGLFG